MPFSNLAISHHTWQVLRAIKRGNGEPVAGYTLRIGMSRRTKDGSFLGDLFAMGLIDSHPAPYHEPEHASKPVAFRLYYTLKPLGEHAAEYGECEQGYGADKGKNPKPTEGE